MLSTKSSKVETMSHYEVEQVVKTAPPEGCEGDDWYRYDIKGERNRITGYARGSLRKVTSYAKEQAVNLNARAEGQSIYPWAPRKR